MQVKISDHFDLEKIIYSGQCFRAKAMGGGVYRFITGGSVVYIEASTQANEEGIVEHVEVSCTKEEWERIWVPYFDLGHSYSALFNAEYGKQPFVDRTMDFSRGLRILKQDKWEMLITFIISQRKSIPAIAKCVEALCEGFGEPLATGREVIYTFPTPCQLMAASTEELAACGLGYRLPYVRAAAELVGSGQLDLAALEAYGSEELLKALMCVHGVGVKVANCVALFAYGRLECAPVDVWIARAIEEGCGGVSPFPLYGDNAGVIQQYMFYYQKGEGK